MVAAFYDIGVAILILKKGQNLNSAISSKYIYFIKIIE